jgi:hypothetical protein
MKTTTIRTLTDIRNDIARIEARPLTQAERDALCEPLVAELRATERAENERHARNLEIARKRNN